MKVDVLVRRCRVGRHQPSDSGALDEQGRFRSRFKHRGCALVRTEASLERYCSGELG